jgi:hypothetical protein
MLVVYQSYIEQEAGYKANQEFMDNADAQLRTKPMFNIVQRRVQKFMTLVSDKGQLTPID